MKRISLAFLLLTMSLVVWAPAAHAQSMSPSVLSLMPQVQAELSKRGLTETEVRSRLMANGIDVDRIPPAELPQYQSRIMRILEELQAEKEGITPSVSTVPVAETRADNPTPEPRRAIVKPDRDIYGHELFSDQGLEIFQTTDGARAPGSYVLGAGDQIRITIFGTSQADLLMEINEDGFVQPTGMPKIFLQGLSLDRARAMLQQRLSSFYTFRSEQFVVTLQTSRTITVNVFGETTLRGSFTISALNTAIHALVAAGGPTEIGSVRNIQLIRGGERRTLDLYALMSDPTAAFRFDLQLNDLVHVPVAQRQVRVVGAVNRPMRYELTGTETLADLIRFAGGVKADAYPDFVQIQRFDQGEVRLLEFELGPVLRGERRVELVNGDEVRIRSVSPRVEKQVSSVGSIYYPGSFGFMPGMTTGDLVRLSGGLTPSASDVAYVERRSLADTTRAEYLPVNLRTAAGMAFVLDANDRLTVYDRTLFGLVGDVKITGAVKQSAELVFSPTLTLADVMKSAGGFDLGAALNRVEVFRVNFYLDRPQQMEQLTLEVDSLYQVVGGTGSGFRLQPYDQIMVRRIPGFTRSRSVELNGEVTYPGVYVLENFETRLSDILKRAGGLRGEADPKAIRLFRTFKNRGFVISDLSKALANPGDDRHDPILFNGDVITIPRRENVVSFRPEGMRFAFVSLDDMEVYEDLAFTFQGRKSARWYIQNLGGGFADDADRWSVTVTLPNGEVRGTKRAFFFFKNYPAVEPGSTIALRMKPEALVQEDKKPVDWDQIYNRSIQTTTTLLTLLILSRQL
jgi:polysaccharide biosynthesis/export protein